MAAAHKKPARLRPFPFLNLPPEIRYKIYALVCQEPLEYVHLDKQDCFTSFPLDFLTVSHQIYHEVRPIYFSHNSFSITIDKHADRWAWFLAPPFSDYRRQMHRLRLVIVRWGTKDWFVRELAPALEDCILNGRLRCLEVYVGMAKKHGEYTPERGPWVSLLKICHDPYLEQMRLLYGSKADLVRIDETDKTKFEVVALAPGLHDYQIMTPRDMCSHE